ncbi:MAG: MerR family transcriptional regulator [Chloroflexota bacterium]|nr:MerR family transcriptional regulator [Chloroflexota bacterium]
MLKIGDFSKLTQVSIRMLRYYDELGLLRPARIDSDSGYRYYTAEQLPRLNRILALQDLGFSLKQITSLLEKDVSSEQLRGMLLQKQAELEDQVREEQERLARVAARLQLLESQGGAADVVVKEVSTQWVASVRDRISSHQSVSYLFDRLFAHLIPLHVQGLAAVIWHDDSHVEEAIDAEGLIYLNRPVEASADVKVYELPAARMATIVHHGAYLTLNSAYDALLHWLDGSGYQIAGPNRELYLHYTLPARQDDDSYVTEIQFPIVL